MTDFTNVGIPADLTGFSVPVGKDAAAGAARADWPSLAKILLLSIPTLTDSEKDDIAAALGVERIPAPATDTQYLGWSATGVVTSADFAGAADTTDHEWIIPDGGPGHIWYAVPMADGAPLHEYVNNFRQPDNAFAQQAGTVTYQSVVYLVIVTAAELVEGAEGQNFRVEY